jgi:putative tricarboxylic transport membrane protein
MVLGAVWLYGAGSIASTTNFIGLGPAAAIYGVGAGLVCLGALLLLQELRGTQPSEPDQAGDRDANDASSPFSARALGLTLAGISVPLLTMKWLGFPLTALLAFVLVTHGFGSRRTGFDVLVGALLASGVWWGFSRLGIALGPFFPLVN